MSLDRIAADNRNMTRYLIPRSALLPALALVVAVGASADTLSCAPDCRGVDLANQTLTNLNLNRVNLVNADLTGASLNCATLADTDLTAAILTRADLRKVDSIGRHRPGMSPAAGSHSGSLG